ncbi:MAG TPA: ATP-binding protein [Candidatus Paceibacterota bacterium]
MILIQEFGILFLVVSSGLTLLLGYLVYTSDRVSTTKRIFFAQCLFIPLWLIVFTFSTRPDISGTYLLFLMRLSLVLAIPVNILFLMLAHTFPSAAFSLSTRSRYVWASIAIVMVGVVISPLTFNNVSLLQGGPKPEVGPGMLLFVLFNFLCYASTFYTLRSRLKSMSFLEERRGLYALSLGMFLMISLMLFTISLPVAMYNITTFVPFGPLYALIFTVCATYGMLRHHLFNARVVATEIFIFTLSAVFFSEIFTVSSSTERVINMVIFAATLFLGALLVRSVKQEIRAREEVRDLARRLTGSNSELARSNEQLKLLGQRKSEFVSIVSHQLRAPVTAIKGYASMLLEGSFGKVPATEKEPLEKIFHSSQRLTEMISDFLNLSKIEQGGMSYVFADVDVKKMLKELVEEFSSAAKKKQLTLDVKLPKKETFVVTGDEGKLRQIFSNLIDNAIKYTPKGMVHILLEKDTTQSVVRVRVADTGIGLSEDDIYHIYGKFTRASGGQKENTEGSGLGLYVAKKMLEAQRGKIWTESPGPGKGSAFIIQLPLKKTP